jgi:YggT family protein
MARRCTAAGLRRPATSGPPGRLLPLSIACYQAVSELMASAPGGVVGTLLTYWYFYLPDYVLAVLMYTVLGRVALSLLIEPTSQNYIWRFFCNVSDPVVAAVSAVTPKAAPPIILWLFSFVWLFWLRFILRVTLTASGLIPVASTP